MAPPTLIGHHAPPWPLFASPTIPLENAVPTSKEPGAKLFRRNAEFKTAEYAIATLPIGWSSSDEPARIPSYARQRHD